MQKINNIEDSTIVFKIKSTTKTKLVKQATLEGKTLSQYLRDLIEIKPIETKGNSLLTKLAGIMTEQEAQEHNDNIYNSRKNKK